MKADLRKMLFDVMSPSISASANVITLNDYKVRRKFINTRINELIETLNEYSATIIANVGIAVASGKSIRKACPIDFILKMSALDTTNNFNETNRQDLVNKLTVLYSLYKYLAEIEGNVESSIPYEEIAI